jgi:hypothetical protein
MQFLRLNSIALAAVSINAAVLPRQETSSSSTTSIPNTYATKKSYLTSITTLPMPTSVEGNTAYPPSTTVVEITAAAQSSTWSTPSSQPPFNWNSNATATNVTANSSIVTASSSLMFATGLSESAANVTAGSMNSTGITSSTRAPYANSTINGLIGNIATTGTAVVVTGFTVANATTTPTTSSTNNTRIAPVASTSTIMQLYLSRPSTLAEKKASATEVPLGQSQTHQQVQLHPPNLITQTFHKLQPTHHQRNHQQRHHARRNLRQQKQHHHLAHPSLKRHQPSRSNRHRSLRRPPKLARTDCRAHNACCDRKGSVE